MAERTSKRMPCQRWVPGGRAKPHALVLGTGGSLDHAVESRRLATGERLRHSGGVGRGDRSGGNR